MTLQRPLAMQASGGDSTFSYAAIDFRQLPAMLWQSEGVIPSDNSWTNLKVTQRGAGANFSVDVAAGPCAITGDDVANQGMYAQVSDAVTNLATPTAPVSGSRTHRVVARIGDRAHNGALSAGTYTWTLEVLQDTGSGTPAVPASAIPLARITIASGQSSVTNANITDDRIPASTVAARPRLVASDSERLPNPPTGSLSWRSDRSGLEGYTGTSYASFFSELVVWKTAGETVNNSAVPQDDDHLFLDLEANARYIVDLFLIYVSVTATPDLRLQFTIPSGAAWSWVPLGLDTSVTATEGIMRMPATTGTSNRNVATVAGTDMVATPRGTIVTGAAGRLRLQWCQGIATAENTQVKVGSFMTAKRIG